MSRRDSITGDCYFKPASLNLPFPVPRYSNGVLPESNHSPGNHLDNHSGQISPSTPPSIEEALKIIHDTERPHASLAVGDGDNGFYLHGEEPSDPPGADGQGDDQSSAKARLNDHDPNSVSTDEVDTGIHVRTEDIQSLDEDSSSLRDYSDMDPDCEAMTRSCPLSDRPERERSKEGGQKGASDADSNGERGDGGDRSSPCPSSAPTIPRSHTASPTSSSGGSGGGMVRMTSFAEQKFRKLEGRSSGGTTPESSDLNVPYTHPARSIPSQVCVILCLFPFNLKSYFCCRDGNVICGHVQRVNVNDLFFLDLHASFAHHIPLPSHAFPQRPFPPDCLRDDSAEDEAGGETESHRSPEEEGKQI